VLKGRSLIFKFGTLTAQFLAISIIKMKATMAMRSKKDKDNLPLKNLILWILPEDRVSIDCLNDVEAGT